MLKIHQMKKILLGIFGMLITTCGLQAQGVIKAEYFFDKDPGLGKGISLTFSSGDSVNVNTSLPLGALSAGYHNVFIRVQDSAQHWSLYMGRNFYIQPAVSIPAPPMITAAEYFFDKDPGQGKGAAMPFFAATDSVSATNAISTVGLTAGYHSMFIRTENSANQWSLYEGRNFYVQPTVTIPSPPQIVAAEYFFDKDPGQGKGTAMPVFAATDSVNATNSISIFGLAVGYHNMFIRTENSANQWSLYEGRNFYVQPTVTIPAPSQIVAAEYFFDKDPGQGKGTLMPAFAATDSINMSTAISLGTLSTGFHNMFIRAENASGQWSLYQGGNFYIAPSVAPQPIARIVAAEYFFDKDPGQGKGNVITGITAADSINITQGLNASALAGGNHNAFIRVKDSTGHWSLYEGRTFKVLTCGIKATVAVTKDSCFGGADGTALATPTGGVGSSSTYKYSWSTTPVQTTALVTGLAAGVYTVTVTDSIGCSATVTATVGQPSPIIVTTAAFATTCGQDNGQAIVTKTTGGTGTTYTYSWNTVPVQTSNSVTGLASGTYVVTVTDVNGCSSANNVVIGASGSPSIVLDTVIQSKCGEHIGSATVSASGGVLPYKFSWNNGNTLATADSLHSGNYIATVTDNNGCSTFISVPVTNSDGPVIVSNPITPVKCYGQANGSIIVKVIGGSTPYTYVWSTGATTSSVSGLPVGPYYVTVSDATGCSGVQAFEITGPSAPVTIVTNTVNSDCTTADGSASASVSGGTAPYAYNWSTGVTTSSVNTLWAGTYSLTVTDANGCKDSTQAAVSSKTGPVIQVDSITAANCAAGIGGTVTISVTGGVPTYTYLWSNTSSSATQNLTGVPAGTYNVMVTDNAGCVGTATAKVPELLPSQISICMVTVDPASNHNYIIWDKSTSPNIASYNIYKENNAPGVFDKIGNVLASSTCTYVDMLSDPDVQSWRYEISQVDACGYESPLSAPHKTMHLTISQGLSNNVNLIWDNYQGISFGHYIVYRDSVAGIAGDSIGSVINNGTFTYTAAAPLASHPWYFHMGIDNPGGCTPAIEAINYNASKSNTGSVIFVGVNQLSVDLNSLEVYPNPSTGVFNFSLNIVNKQNITVKIYNAIGQVLSSTNYGRISGQINKELDLTGLSKGVYILQVVGDNGVAYKKVILQ